MDLIRSIVLFGLAALAEIGGARLVWQGWREHRGLLWIAAGWWRSARMPGGVAA